MAYTYLNVCVGTPFLIQQWLCIIYTITGYNDYRYHRGIGTYRVNDTSTITYTLLSQGILPFPRLNYFILSQIPEAPMDPQLLLRSTR